MALTGSQSTLVEVSFCGNTRAIRDGPCCTSRGNSLPLMKLSSINNFRSDSYSFIAYILGQKRPSRELCLPSS